MIRRSTVSASTVDLGPSIDVFVASLVPVVAAFEAVADASDSRAERKAFRATAATVRTLLKQLGDLKRRSGSARGDPDTRTESAGVG
jgi:hypothetical protein